MKLVESHTPTGGGKQLLSAASAGPGAVGGGRQTQMAFGGERKEEEGGRAVTPSSPSPNRQERGLLWGGERDQEIIKRRKGTIMGATDGFLFSECVWQEERGRGNVDGSKCVLLYIFYVQINFS